MANASDEIYPLLLEPILKEKVWGGRALERLGKPLPPGRPIGESWELADLPEGRSVVRNGHWAGRTLRSLLAEQGPAILGAAVPAEGNGFPLLVKYLDARENLSVQVHPSPDYARAHPEAHLKSEAWYVIEAEPGAVIYAGLRPGLDQEQLRADVQSGRIVDDLQTIPARPGECLYLPSGTCHALGAGIVVAEVQTPSDTTFRLYDWGRTDRQLHLDQALACIDFDDPAAPPPVTARPPIVVGPVETRPLLRTGHFGLEMIDVRRSANMPVISNGLPEVWMVLSGGLRISNSCGPTVDVALGETTLLPAGLREPRVVVAESARMLRITLPSAVGGLIA